MNDRITNVEGAITQFTGVKITSPFEKRGEIIHGRIALSEQHVTLSFDVEIYPQYPFQFHDSETIRFINTDLLVYDHINSDGSVCVHTSHHPELSQKIALDLNGLRHWVIKYYINRDVDTKYEHIVVNNGAVNGHNYVFLFTEVDFKFNKGMHGQFQYSVLRKGRWKKEDYITLLVQSFVINRNHLSCKWSNTYQQLDTNEGIFYYYDRPPVENSRFTVKSFHQLENFFSQEFLMYLNTYAKKIQFKGYHASHFPLLIGYPINEHENHWQVILIPTNEFPNYGQKITGTDKWISRLKEQPIIWGETRNCSYSYFFGRGAFHHRITEARILIIGTGAIGSMISTTLVRGGATNIMLVDHDIKEAENICRSEYGFLHGLTSKVSELTNKLIAISPFVEVNSSETLVDLLKIVINDDKTSWLSVIKEHFNQYDIIFDCSTDNDIAFMLDRFELKGEVFSMSITNHARELVCATKQNLYLWLKQIFYQLERESEDLYAPTGCWSPTFKASYNDISVLVQFSLRHINHCFKQSIALRNFYLFYAEEDEITIKMKQF